MALISDIREYMAKTAAASDVELAAALDTDIELVRMTLDFMLQKKLVNKMNFSCDSCTSACLERGKCENWYSLQEK